MKKSLKWQIILSLTISVAVRIALQLTLGGDINEKIPEDLNIEQLRDISDNDTIQGLLDVIGELEE